MKKKALLLPAAVIFVPLITVMACLYAGILIPVGTFRHIDKPPVVSEITQTKHQDTKQNRWRNQTDHLEKKEHGKQHPQSKEKIENVGKVGRVERVAKVGAVTTKDVYDPNQVIEAPIVDQGGAITGTITGVNPTGTVRVNNVA